MPDYPVRPGQDPDHPAADRLDGAGDFAAFVYGEDTLQNRKKVYRDVALGVVPAGRWHSRLFGSKRRVAGGD